MFGQPGYVPYGGYGSTVPVAQQRLAQMEAQYPQYAAGGVNTYPQMGNPLVSNQGPSMTPVIKGRPVSNVQEANAAMIDFDGSVFVFLDKAHNKIYTKQLGMDGNIQFEEYSRTVSPNMASEASQGGAEPTLPPGGYVTTGELEEALSGLYNRISTLEQNLQAPPSVEKGGNKK